MVSHYTYWSPQTDKRCPTPEGEIYCYPGLYKSVPHRLYHNLGHGKFEDVMAKFGFGGVAGKGMGIAIAEFNRDGVARLSRRFSGWSNAIVDYDIDGRKDIYSANGDVDYIGSNAAQHDTMFHNVDGKVFADVSAGLGSDFLAKGYQRGSAYGDLNGDGFPDLVVTSLNKTPRILLNSGDNGKHWLWLDLVGNGRKTSRDAIGAQVKLTTAAGRVLYNHVSLSVGSMSSSDRRVHFGLGGTRPCVRSRSDGRAERHRRCGT